MLTMQRDAWIGSSLIVCLAWAGMAIAAGTTSPDGGRALGRRSLLGCVDTFPACPGWAGQCAVPGVATYCPCMCGGPSEDKCEKCKPSGGCKCDNKCNCITMLPPPAPLRRMSGGCVDTFPACPGWAGQCAVPGVATYCPCMCGGGPKPPGPSPPPASPPTGPVVVNPRLPSGPLMVGYFESWSARWAGSGSDHQLAKIPGYVNVVAVAFAKPDCSYSKGSLSLAGTGLSFSSDGRVVRDAIKALKAAQPNTRVLLSVGGGTREFSNWAGLNTRCIRDLVDDLGFDGVDIDYEPQANCQASGGVVRCPTDVESVSVTTALRSALPAGQYILSTASWHVGMYGEGAFAGARPVSPYTGGNLAMAKSPAGQSLDLINIMTYDAGNPQSTGFDYRESYRAHRAIWKTQAISIGVEVPPEAWGGNVITLAEVSERANYAKSLAGVAQYGFMLWALQKAGCPSSQQITSAVCNLYALGGCSNALPVVTQTC